MQEPVGVFHTIANFSQCFLVFLHKKSSYHSSYFFTRRHAA